MSGASKQGAGLANRAWASIRKALGLHDVVGKDGNGNAYYRWTEKLEGVVTERRRVKVPGGDFLYDPKSIPPEWRAWLAKTRQEPPTEEEMGRRLERAAVMQQRVAALEERERLRRFRQASLGAAAGPDMGRFVAQLGQQGFGQDARGGGGGSSNSSSRPEEQAPAGGGAAGASSSGPSGKAAGGAAGAGAGQEQAGDQGVGMWVPGQQRRG